MKSIVHYITILSILTRVYLSLAVAFSACAGSLLFNHAFTETTSYTFLGVFLLSAAASALNQYQERNSDKKMSRTQNRPLPSGKITPRNTIYISSILLTAGIVVLYWGTTTIAMFLGIFNLAWYIIVYTPLKQRTAYALLIGALNGAIPPIIGWIAVGGNIVDVQIVLVASFMYLWQIPHFWLLSIRYADDYKTNHIPSFNFLVRQSLVNPILFLWILSTALSTLLFLFFKIITNPVLIVFLVFADFLLIVYFALMVFKKPALPTKTAFQVINGFQALMLIFIIIEAFS